MVSAKEKAQSIIKEHNVVVFSKSYCPYCSNTKRTLKAAGAEAYILELDEIEDGDAIQDALHDLTGQRTVPNIFIGHEHIGGNSDLQAKKGQLDQLLKDAGAL